MHVFLTAERLQLRAFTDTEADADADADTIRTLPRPAVTHGRMPGPDRQGVRLDKGFAALGVERVTANTMTVNTRSRRVREKAGLMFVRAFSSDWHLGPAGT
jgi:hypothetical protein